MSDRPIAIAAGTSAWDAVQHIAELTGVEVAIDWNAPPEPRTNGLTGDERSDIRRRWEAGEQPWESHDPGECATCDELRRLNREG